MKKFAVHLCTALLVGVVGYLCGALLIRPVYYDMTYQGVHVCLSQHFKQTTLRCTQDDWVFTRSQVAGIYVSYTGPSGGNFTDKHSTVDLCCVYFPVFNTHGGYNDGYIVGQLTKDTRFGSHVLAVRLSQVTKHLRAGYLKHDRSTQEQYLIGQNRYRILVFNGRTDRGTVLGTATIAVL
jgi:hypothetical protein